MKFLLQLRVRILLPVLLLAVCMTQASSSVCGAQCVEHQAPMSSAHSMAHCHAMMEMPPQIHGAALISCPGAAHSLCSVDLLANVQTKSSLQTSALWLKAGHLAGPATVSVPRPSPVQRSNIGPPPLITALRV